MRGPLACAARTVARRSALAGAATIWLLVVAPVARAAEGDREVTAIGDDVVDGRSHWRAPARARGPGGRPDGRADWIPPLGKAVPDEPSRTGKAPPRLDVTVDGSLRSVPRRPLTAPASEPSEVVDPIEGPIRVPDAAARAGEIAGPTPGAGSTGVVGSDVTALATPVRSPSGPAPSRGRGEGLSLWLREPDRETWPRGIGCDGAGAPESRREAEARDGRTGDGAADDREAFERSLRRFLDDVVSPSALIDGASREWVVMRLGCRDAVADGAPPPVRRPAVPEAVFDEPRPEASPDERPTNEERDEPSDEGDLFLVGDDIPAGFEALTAPQTVVVDLWFNGRRRGTVQVTTTAEEVVFDRPSEVIALIGDDLRDPDALLAPLASPLPANTDRLCFADGDPPGCGTVEGDPLAVIHDEGSLRIDLFVAASLQNVQPREASRYLADPNRRGASILTLRTTASSLSGQGENVDADGRLLSGYGRGNVSIAASHGSLTGETRLHELKLTHHARGHEFTTGTYEWVPGGAWTGIDVFGVGFSTSFRTRIDLEQAFGSELVVFLPRRAVVRLIVEGRVLDGASYPAGNHVLDTSALPEGTYPVEIRIVENDGTTRSEFRTFSRSVRIPPPGEPVFGATAGVVRAEDELLPGREATLLSGFTLSNRITDRAAWQLGMLQLGDRGFAQGELIYLGERLSAQGAATVGRDSTIGTDLRLSVRSPFGLLGLSHRRFASDVEADEDPALARLYPASGTQWDVSATRTIGHYALRASAGRSRSTDGAGVTRELVRHDLGIGRSLSLGRGLRGSIQGAFSRVGDDRLLSLRATLFFGRGSLGGALRTEAVRRREGDVGLGLGASLDRESRVAEAEWGAGVYGQVGDEREAGANAWLDHPLYAARLSSDVAWPGTDESARVSTIATASTQIGLDAQGAAIGGNRVAESGVIVAIEGEPAGAAFDIVVNGVRVSGGTIGTTRFVGLQPFESYLIKLIPVGVSANGFGADVYEVTLYPGSVERIAFTATRQVLVVAEIVDEGGEPLGNAVIETADGPLVTDAFGYLQADLAPGTSLELRRADGSRCTLEVPDAPPGEELLVLDVPLVCRPPESGSLPESDG